MGKLNLANISTGLEKVKSITETLSNVAHFENVPAEYIETADYNPFAEGDTDESRYNLAMSIQASGLIEPLAVNKKAPDKYKLISGEHRFSAIRQYLSFKNIPCMVFEGMTDDEAQLKLYEANSYREYTAEQKLKRYQELESLLTRMKEDGKYQGAIQKGIAARLGVSTHQVRKYKKITESLSAEQQQKVLNGEISIDKAYQLANPTPPSAVEPIPESPEDNEKSGRPSAFGQESNTVSSNTTTKEDDKTPQLNLQIEDDNKTSSTLNNAYWDAKIKCAIKNRSDLKKIFLFYTFEVPTTQEAIKDILKPVFGTSGYTVVFPNGERGWMECTSNYIELQYKSNRQKFSYALIDAYIREMIRNGEWLSTEKIQAAIKEKLNKIK